MAGMAISLNHSVPFGAYGGALAPANKWGSYADMALPFMQQYFGQEYESGEAGRQRTFQASESAAERAMRESLQQQQLTWQAAQAELDRELQRWQSRYMNPQTSTFRFVGGYNGPGSFASEQQRIRSKYFG